MGSAGDKPRKRRLRMPKVPRGEETQNIQLAGLTNSGGDVHGSRLAHETARGRSENVGRFGKFILRRLGRWPKENDPTEPE
jgi:hypothetical protein